MLQLKSVYEPAAMLIRSCVVAPVFQLYASGGVPPVICVLIVPFGLPHVDVFGISVS